MMIKQYKSKLAKQTFIIFISVLSLIVVYFLVFHKKTSPSPLLERVSNRTSSIDVLLDIAKKDKDYKKRRKTYEQLITYSPPAIKLLSESKDDNESKDNYYEFESIGRTLNNKNNTVYYISWINKSGNYLNLMGTLGNSGLLIYTPYSSDRCAKEKCRMIDVDNVVILSNG